MAHDPTKVLMGTTQSSYKVVTPHKGAIPAGTIVRQKNDGTISVAAADGSPLGISLGKDLSNTGFTAVVRQGLRVPVLLTSAFNPAIGAQVHISDTTGLAIAAGEGATGMNAHYVTGRLAGGGIAEDGSTVGVALIDFGGGL
jgi:hypothetical protein